MTATHSTILSITDHPDGLKASFDGSWVPCNWSALPKTPTLDIDLAAIRQGTTIPIDFLFLRSDQGSACRRAKKAAP
jgi:hypothetical protein